MRGRSQSGRSVPWKLLILLLLIGGLLMLGFTAVSAQDDFTLRFMEDSEVNHTYWQQFPQDSWYNDSSQPGVSSQLNLIAEDPGWSDSTEPVEVQIEVQGQFVGSISITAISIGNGDYRIPIGSIDQIGSDNIHPWRPIEVMMQEDIDLDRTGEITYDITITHHNSGTSATHDLDINLREYVNHPDSDIALTIPYDPAIETILQEGEESTIIAQFDQPPSGADDWFPAEVREFQSTLVIAGEVEHRVIDEWDFSEASWSNAFHYGDGQDRTITGAIRNAPDEWVIDHDEIVETTEYQYGDPIPVEIYLEDSGEAESFDVTTKNHAAAGLIDGLPGTDMIGTEPEPQPGQPDPSDPIFAGILTILLLSSAVIVVGFAGGHWVPAVGGTWFLWVALAMRTGEITLMALVLVVGLIMAAATGRWAGSVAVNTGRTT